MKQSSSEPLWWFMYAYVIKSIGFGLERAQSAEGALSRHRRRNTSGYAVSLEAHQAPPADTMETGLPQNAGMSNETIIDQVVVREISPNSR
uniref:Uncharacterized protein n=1 Tax=Vespula pensylvanica TaxID=30213 RepID=A0A834P2D7_VESPE|nr:hypothetical protein H0235_007860 [Vespula pensylvanica]